MQNTKSKLSFFGGYYAKDFAFSKISCTDKSTVQMCHINVDKDGKSLILITNKGNHYTSSINGLNTKIDLEVSFMNKISEQFEESKV